MDNSDDPLFADALEFDEEPLENNTISASISKRKDVDSPRSGIEEDDVGYMANDSNDSNIESAFTSVPDYIEFLPRQPNRNRTERVLYPSQIVYGSEPLPKVNAKAPEVGESSSSANFVSSRRAKFHENMV